MPELITAARNAGLEDMLEILRTQHAHKLDMVIPGSKLRFEDASLVLKGFDVDLSEEGVTDPNGTYTPTGIFDEKLSEYLDIPVRYVRRMREKRPDLYDANANGWFTGRKAKVRKSTKAEIESLATEENDAMFEQFGDWFTTLRAAVPADDRKFLVRLFQDGDTGTGVARAILSNRYKVMENLDGLMALLAGIKDAGIDPQSLRFDRCDLTERRMYVKVTAPEIQAAAPELLKGYRNPFADGRAERAEAAVRGRNLDEWRRIAEREGMAYSEEEGGEPIVFAGFVFSNSEVGGGKWSVMPAIEVQVCKNGLILTEDAFGKVHLGGALEEGQIDWSSETQEKNLALVKAQTSDVVKQFLNADYVQGKVDDLSERSGVKLKKPAEDITAVCKSKKLGFSDADTAGILEHFMLGGQITAGGLMNAITSYSQTLTDADAAFALDTKAVEAMDLAAARR